MFWFQSFKTLKCMAIPYGTPDFKGGQKIPTCAKWVDDALDVFHRLFTTGKNSQVPTLAVVFREIQNVIFTAKLIDMNSVNNATFEIQ